MNNLIVPITGCKCIDWMLRLIILMTVIYYMNIIYVAINEDFYKKVDKIIEYNEVKRLKMEDKYQQDRIN